MTHRSSKMLHLLLWLIRIITFYITTLQKYHVMCLSVVNSYANCLCTYWSVAVISCLFVFDSCKKIVKLGNQSCDSTFLQLTFSWLFESRVWCQLPDLSGSFRDLAPLHPSCSFSLLQPLVRILQTGLWRPPTPPVAKAFRKTLVFVKNMFPQFTVANWINNCDINKVYKNEPWKIYVVVIYWHIKGLVTRLNLISADVFFKKSGSHSA